MDPLGLYDVAFFQNIYIGSWSLGHPAIISGDRHLYYKTIDQAPSQGIPHLGKVDNIEFIPPGGINVYKLNSEIFKDEHILQVQSNPYGTPFAIPGYSSHCASYSADVLNCSIREYNKKLPWGKRLPEVNGFSPSNLFWSLYNNGYITSSYHISPK